MMCSISKICLPIVLAFCVGFQWHRGYYFPLPQLHQWKIELFNINMVKYQPPVRPTIPQEFYPYLITPYRPHLPLYIDRGYYDDIGGFSPLDAQILQIPRHHNKSIVFTTDTAIDVYRFVGPDVNLPDPNIWTPLNESIHVTGLSCILNKVVKRTFPPGEVILGSGGPFAASPILIAPSATSKSIPSLKGIP